MEKNISVKEHGISLVNRTKMSLSGVSEVTEFSDNCVQLKTCMGGLTVKGKKLTINQLDTDKGTLDVNGEIDMIRYSSSGKDGFFAGLFK